MTDVNGYAIKGSVTSYTFVLFAAAALARAIPAKAGASEDDAAAQFVRDFTDEAIGRLTDDRKTADEKTAAFRELLVRGFYLDGIGRFVLGTHWRRLESQQQDEYLNAFEDYLVATYSRRLDAYSGEQLRVLGAKRRKKDFIVQSTLSGSDIKNMRIDWRVRRMDGDWKIVDITVEGISMVVTQRSEFASVLRANDGDVNVLVAGLREKWVAFKDSEADTLATN